MIGTVGLTAIVSEDYPQFAIKNVGLFKTNGNKLLANWLHYYFHSYFAQKYIRNNLKGTTQKYLPLYALRKFPIILPPVPEQRKIVETLHSLDSVLCSKREKRKKLVRMKRRLMDLLLTGKVRVRV